ncbi:MAG: hypothetical protein ACRD3M_12870 [Thermoanaerobaculia bacterium]
MDRETAEDIKQHFNVVAEGLRSEIRLLAEGLGGTNERLDRFEAHVSAEFKLVREELGEVKAMIRLSFGELDRRIQSLENDVSSLRARLERLESRYQA